MRTREAWEVARDIRLGSLDPVDHAERILEAIERNEGRIRAFISLRQRGSIRALAEEASRRVRRGERIGKLAGLLVSVKDNICTRGLPTTAGSRMLEGFVPPYDATVVERLEAEGAIIVGKTNLDEFAMGSTTELSAFGPTKNPWDPRRVPGGSSGGSAASLAYGGADLSLGSDTGGSARLPAAFTATVGLKPTYGRVSRYGLIPYGNSLEQISPMARSVRDVALLLEVIGGFDPRDATSLPLPPPDLLSAAQGPPREICIVEEMISGAEEPLERSFWRIVHRMESEGFSVEIVKIPSLRWALPTYYTIAFAEAASNLARYVGIFYPMKSSERRWEDYVEDVRARGFGPEVKRRILMGVYALSEGFREDLYVAATKVRRVIRDEVWRVARRCVIASQASPILPPFLGERVKDPLKLYYMDMYTVVANLAGIPAMVQPIGFYEGLPIGIQWMAEPMGENKLISIGLFVEEMTGIRGVIAE